MVSLTVKNKTKEARPLQTVTMWVKRGKGGSRGEVSRRENGEEEGQRWKKKRKGKVKGEGKLSLVKVKL